MQFTPLGPGLGLRRKNTISMINDCAVLMVVFLPVTRIWLINKSCLFLTFFGIQSGSESNYEREENLLDIETVFIIFRNNIREYIFLFK